MSNPVHIDLTRGRQYGRRQSYGGTGAPGGGDFLPDIVPPNAKQHRVLVSEERVVDPDTGGEKGMKLERFDLVPVQPLREVARVYGVGARKYAERNWQRGYKWSLSYQAAMRHLTAFWDGETYDPETGLHHAAHAIFHCLAMIEFQATHQEKDDRPNSPYVQQNTERRVGPKNRRVSDNPAGTLARCNSPFGDRGTVSSGGRRDGEHC